LPATALASSNVATYGILNYAKHRRQFNIPLIKMEGIQSKFVDIIFNTWLINCSIKLTNTILDMGEKPAVISAIMKQQTTDRGRDVLNNAMDIHAGSSICLGENNFLEKFYRSAPVGITVEGSNTLTRNLIIFGQGLNKSHPHIYPVLDSILSNDFSKFKSAFNDIVLHSVGMMLKSTVPCFSQDVEAKLRKQTINFAHLSNIVALKGGSIKKEQFLSADMADVFSNLYLSYSVLWEYKNYKTSRVLSDYCIERLLNDNQKIFNKIIDNYDLIGKLPILHLKGFISSPSYKEDRKLIDEVLDNKNIINVIKEDIYTKDNILGKMEILNELDQNSESYKDLYDDIIQVGEYPIN
jgi:acyl-CoA dehydrogenase